MPLWLTESDVRAVLAPEDLMEPMEAALAALSAGEVLQPVRTAIEVAGRSFFASMPALYKARGILGAKLVTVFPGNAERGIHTHLAAISLFDDSTGELLAVADGRYITEVRTAAVSAVSVRHLARAEARVLAILGSGVQARSHLAALPLVRNFEEVRVWSPTAAHLERFVDEALGRLKPAPPGVAPGGPLADGAPHGPGLATKENEDARWVGPPAEGRTGGGVPFAPADRGSAQRRDSQSRDQGAPRQGALATCQLRAARSAQDAVRGADVIVLATSSVTPAIDSRWVDDGAHVISIGACRPSQREIDPALVARARLFVDSRAAALAESGDVVQSIAEGRFGPDHIRGELGEVIAGRAPGRISGRVPDRTAGHPAPGRTSDREVTLFKSLGQAVEDLVAAGLAYRRALEAGRGIRLTLT